MKEHHFKNWMGSLLSWSVFIYSIFIFSRSKTALLSKNKTLHLAVSIYRKHQTDYIMPMESFLFLFSIQLWNLRRKYERDPKDPLKTTSMAEDHPYRILALLYVLNYIITSSEKHDKTRAVGKVIDRDRTSYSTYSNKFENLFSSTCILKIRLIYV